LLEVDVSDAELKQRLTQWKPLPPKYTSGVFAKYAALVQSAGEGAITQPHNGRS
jgi:dihydroxy-acid dehydratase